jgi:Domain of unknown function (DUF397)
MLRPATCRREEVREPMRDDLSRAQWKKSSYSGNSGNCVEVADLGSSVAVRDSKDPYGPVLIYTRDEWQGLIRSAKSGEPRDSAPR